MVLKTIEQSVDWLAGFVCRQSAAAKTELPDLLNLVNQEPLTCG